MPSLATRKMFPGHTAGRGNPIRAWGSPSSEDTELKILEAVEAGTAGQHSGEEGLQKRSRLLGERAL